jgi:hypothetical protein
VPQLLDDLLQQPRYSVIVFRDGQQRSRSFSHFRVAAADEFVAIYLDEFLKSDIGHSLSVRQPMNTMQSTSVHARNSTQSITVSVTRRIRICHASSVEEIRKDIEKGGAVDELDD